MMAGAGFVICVIGILPEDLRPTKNTRPWPPRALIGSNSRTATWKPVSSNGRKMADNIMRTRARGSPSWLGVSLYPDTLQQTEKRGRNTNTLANGAGHTFNVDPSVGGGGQTAG